MPKPKANHNAFITIFLHPEQSGYNASLTLAHGLKEKGHTVVYIGYHRFEEFIRKQGFDYVCLLDKERFEDLVKRPGPKTTWKLSALMKEGIERWLETETPDLVLLDQFAWEQAGAFLKKKIPLLPINTCLAGFYHSAVPPVFSPLLPNSENGGVNPLKNAMAWGKIRLFHGIVSLINKKVMAPFIREIETNGVAIGWGEYGRRLRLPELVLCPREFDFPITGQTLTNRTYAGACVHNAPNTEPFDWGKIDRSKTIIYCSVGSHPRFALHRRKLFSAAIEAVKNRLDTHLLLQAANPKDIEALQSFPPNVSVHEWVPQLEILSQSSLFITHGGLSSVRESIFHGVPMLVFPAVTDQPGNSARVQYHNLGLTGNAAKITPDSLGKMIDHVLENPQIQSAIKKMKTHFQHQEHCTPGIQKIEQTLS
jgi:MGT family glycosyltransferase